MQRIKKDAIVTFIENKDVANKEFALDDKLFSIPYSKILQAEEFCKLENLDYCYLGFKHYIWHTGLETVGLDPIIKITQKGISEETRKLYIIEIAEV